MLYCISVASYLASVVMAGLYIGGALEEVFEWLQQWLQRKIEEPQILAEVKRKKSPPKGGSSEASGGSSGASKAILAINKEYWARMWSEHEKAVTEAQVSLDEAEASLQIHKVRECLTGIQNAHTPVVLPTRIRRASEVDAEDASRKLQRSSRHMLLSDGSQVSLSRKEYLRIVVDMPPDACHGPTLKEICPVCLVAWPVSPGGKGLVRSCPLDETETVRRWC